MCVCVGSPGGGVSDLFHSQSLIVMHVRLNLSVLTAVACVFAAMLSGCLGGLSRGWMAMAVGVATRFSCFEVAGAGGAKVGGASISPSCQMDCRRLFLSSTDAADQQEPTCLSESRFAPRFTVR